MHFTEILSLAAHAWREIKDASDPEFNNCQITHRENLGAAAEAVVNSGLAFSPFEKAVLRIYKADAEAEVLSETSLATLDTPHPLAGHAENAQMAAVREAPVEIQRLAKKKATKKKSIKKGKK